MNASAGSIDIAGLVHYLEHCLASFRGPLTLTKFPGGQSNPTYLLAAASGRYVLRCQPPGKLLKSAHAVDREYRVQRALRDSAVPVATVLHLCEDPAVIGVKFYLMSFEEGRIFQDPALPDIAPSARADFYREAVRILAALHEVDFNTAGLADFGRAGNYFERQLGIWSSQYRASETRPIAAMEQLQQWVTAHCPPDDGCIALVHGDFRLDNILFDATAPEGRAVLDWELSTLGHPLADLAYFCMSLRIKPNQQAFGLGGMDRGQLGIPDEAALVSHYCELRGLPSITHWTFYLAFSFFRLAAILQGVFKRSLDGNASNARAHLMGEMVEELAVMALDAVAEGPPPAAGAEEPPC